MKGEQHSGGDEGREHDDRQAAAANRGAETSDEEHDEESTTHSTLAVGCTRILGGDEPLLTASVHKPTVDKKTTP